MGLREAVELLAILCLIVAFVTFGNRTGITGAQKEWACHNAYQEAMTEADTLRLRLDHACPAPEEIVVPSLSEEG